MLFEVAVEDAECVECLVWCKTEVYEEFAVVGDDLVQWGWVWCVGGGAEFFEDEVDVVLLAVEGVVFIAFVDVSDDEVLLDLV